jgi:hypothetical protein
MMYFRMDLGTDGMLIPVFIVTNDDNKGFHLSIFHTRVTNKWIEGRKD